jgi:hypothetical protein
MEEINALTERIIFNSRLLRDGIKSYIRQLLLLIFLSASVANVC